MTVTSSGINHSRLVFLYFGDIEVWRLTTAMPTSTGIEYTISKDMTGVVSLLREPQKVIIHYNNRHDSTLTGELNVTITALYYRNSLKAYCLSPGFNCIDAIMPPQQILAISSLSSNENKTSAMELPFERGNVSLTFPPNVERALVTVFASAHGQDASWYRGLPPDLDHTFGDPGGRPGGPLGEDKRIGKGSIREVQVLIDGRLTGFAWPNPSVYSNGINPGLWSPIVAMDAASRRLSSPPRSLPLLAFWHVASNVDAD